MNDIAFNIQFVASLDIAYPDVIGEKHETYKDEK